MEERVRCVTLNGGWLLSPVTKSYGQMEASVDRRLRRRLLIRRVDWWNVVPDDGMIGDSAISETDQLIGKCCFFEDA